MILRDYQSRAVEAVLSSLDERPILCMPTGSGKTITAVEIIKRFGLRTIFMAHRRELISQAASHLLKYGIKAGIIQSGFTEHRSLPVQVASVQTLARRDAPHSDLVIVDECHHVTNANTYNRILAKYPHAKLLGLTATPQRLDGRGLGTTFSKIIIATTARELCNNGTLLAPIVYAPPSDSMQGVRITMGDYNMAQAAERHDKPKLIGAIIETWLKHAIDRRTICFAINIAHSRHIVDRFIQAGVAAEHLDGTMPAVQRAGILRRLRTGETTIVSQCNVLTEGWDLPSLEVAIIARPTASVVLHLQMLGRIMRAADGKDGALCLDHTSNSHRHGLVTDDRVWSLDDTAKARRTAPGETVVRTCPECYLIVPAGCHECPGCGHEFKVETAVPKEHSGELVLQESFWTSVARRAAKANDNKKRFWSNAFQWAGDYKRERGISDYAAFALIAKERGYKEGWAKVAFKNKFGRWPSNAERV